MGTTLSQLAPFNEHRFDAIMAYMAYRTNRALTQYEMGKLHVLIDVLHVMKYGQPVIGGQLQAWPLGPIVDEAYNRVICWGHAKRNQKIDPEYFWIGRRGSIVLCIPRMCPSKDDFAESELSVMREAWSKFMGMNDEQREEYFHTEKSFVGRAYLKAKSRHPEGTRDIEMSWDDLIDEYAVENHTSRDYIQYLKQSAHVE